MPKGQLVRLTLILAMGQLLTACWTMRPGNMEPREMMEQNRDLMRGTRMMDQVLPPPEVTSAPTATPGGSTSVSYRKDLQSIFDRECVDCHGGQAGLYMDSYDRLMSGSASGPVVIPGDPQASELVRSIQGLERPLMPPDEALPATDIDNIVTWIAEGCPNN